MLDAVFGWITGNDFCKDPGVRVYINSLAACGFKGDVVIFTSEMPAPLEELLKAHGFQVIYVPPAEIHQLYRDRHLAYYRYLVQTKKRYRYILNTDTRDTFFQKDPFKYIDQNPYGWVDEGEVLLVAEGFKHSASPINTVRQEHYQQHLVSHKEEFKDWEVINGGTMLASHNRMKDLNLAIWLAGTGIEAGNQCALNYLYRIIQHDSTVSYTYPTEPFCLTGEGLNIKPDALKCDIENGLIVNAATRQAYYMIHQWDRTQYAKDILAKWS